MLLCLYFRHSAHKLIFTQFNKISWSKRNKNLHNICLSHSFTPLTFSWRGEVAPAPDPLARLVLWKAITWPIRIRRCFFSSFYHFFNYSRTFFTFNVIWYFCTLISRILYSYNFYLVYKRYRYFLS